MGTAIKKASLDDYSASPFARANFECSRADEAVELARRLDGKVHTELCLDDATGWRVNIGGGPERYVAVKFDSAGNSFAYANPAAATTQRVDLCVGGQPGTYEPAIICPFPLIAEAIHEFFGDPSSTAGRWRRD